MRAAQGCRANALPWLVGIGLLGSVFSSVEMARAAELDEAQAAFRRGDYDACIAMAKAEIEEGTWNEQWPILKLEAELITGQYLEAIGTMGPALRRHRRSIHLVLLGREVLRYAGQDAEAEALMTEFENRLLASPELYISGDNLVSLGRFFLTRGADAKAVLDQFYDAAITQRPEDPEAYMASAALALDKSDNALAVETLSNAPQSATNDPDFHVLMARALAQDDRAASAEALDRALQLNPRHVPSLLLIVDQLIDSERYAEAETQLEAIEAINPSEPLAWAYRAVLAHLRGERTDEDLARLKALAHWKTNPEVDHRIGLKISQKYRFEEGAAYQRRALAMDPTYTPAKVQLCQDLLRLGKEEPGWSLAEEVHREDGYNLEAFNLLTLRDALDGFRTLRADGLIVRMTASEADLYGDRVLDLLQRAKATLEAKYEVTIDTDEPVLVEIFPELKDFSVRTFGMPGARGFLGVCFGPVITAISPAAQGATPSNWESVLWHEYCHVVTLHKTANKMPRWLSEGISVFEEGLENPAWRRPVNPVERAFLLGEELTPLSQLSGAFLAPESPIHLQFAYFESALAVEFLVERAGFDALKAILNDLAVDVPIDQALARRTGMSLEALDRDFEQFARAHAEAVGADLTWEQPDAIPSGPQALEAWLESHPDSFWGLLRLAALRVRDGDFDRAEPILRDLLERYPEYLGPKNAYRLLARVYRERGDRDAEQAVLGDWIVRSGDAAEALRRLIAMDREDRDWTAMADHASALLAIDPLASLPHRSLAEASARIGQLEQAETSYRAWLSLDPTDRAEVYYRLAEVLHRLGKPGPARRAVLQALEEAPRFLDAHRLLLEIVDDQTAPETEPVPSEEPAP